MAEVCAHLGNLLPIARRVFWRAALRLNPHHEVAAANLALDLVASFDWPDLGPNANQRSAQLDEAWTAFERCLTQFENPRNTSASDLYLSRWPGRLARRLASRWLWGRLGGLDTPGVVHSAHDQALQSALRQLAKRHAALNTQQLQGSRAQRALDAWQAFDGETPALTWAQIELDWATTTEQGASMTSPWPGAPSDRSWKRLQDAVERGIFVSPLDTLTWGRRLLGLGHLQESQSCYAWARHWIPEEAATWRGSADAAARAGDDATAQHGWHRALALNPQDLASFLALRTTADGTAEATNDATNDATVTGKPIEQADRGVLTLDGPSHLALDGEGTVKVLLQDVPANDVVVHWLPPAGWGLVTRPRQTRLDANGCGEVQVLAKRPDRLQGQPWELWALALGPSGYHLASLRVEVADSRPAKILLTVTEDHEIHEERGGFDIDSLHRVLVDKSRFAADFAAEQGAPWTHMVETGSVLAMTQAASDRGPGWQQLDAAVRRHLAQEVARGHDLQPHLHTFNDPAYGHFPYTFDPEGGGTEGGGTAKGAWRPSFPFLASDAQKRGDFATACPPPNHEDPPPYGFDRIESVERAVALLETVGRLGSPDYRPVLWRSGLLEYGDGAADCAWSAVALRRAGLLADSDVLATDPQRGAAFAAGWEQPFSPRPQGPLVQLPIVGNLEGGYLQGRRRLRRQARSYLQVAKEQSGVRVLTLLTHDKFINARRGRDEFSDDPDYGDWPVISEHLDAWRRGGAELVTAAEAVQRVVDDVTWTLQATLRDETFVLSTGSATAVRYRLTLLGSGIEVSDETPQLVLVAVPCAWRGRLRGVTAAQEDRDLEVLDLDERSFWLQLASRQTVHCTLDLAPAASAGPRLQSLKRDDASTWSLVITSEAPFLAARLLLPWHDDFRPLQRAPRVECLDDTEVADDTEVGPNDGASQPRVAECSLDDDGLVLEGVCFASDRLGRTRPLRLRLVASGEAVSGEEERQ